MKYTEFLEKRLNNLKDKGGKCSNKDLEEIKRLEKEITFRQVWGI